MRPLMILSLLLITTFLRGQGIAPTTEAEYNYGAVGYKIQLQARLDTKQGYYIKDHKGCEESDRSMEFKVLYRDGEAHPCAVIAIYTKIRLAPLYFCVPTSDADPAILEKFYKSLTSGTDNPAEQLQFMTYCLSELMMDFAGGKL